MKAIIFKFKGNEFRTPSLNGWQKLAVAIFRFTGIEFYEKRHVEQVRKNLWELHANDLQNELNEERQRGWGFNYLTGKRVDF